MGCNQILDRYIEQLIETSTPQAPAWNIEKIRAGKENTWDYIDGCMIKALIELYEITGEQRYLTFEMCIRDSARTARISRCSTSSVTSTTSASASSPARM